MLMSQDTNRRQFILTSLGMMAAARYGRAAQNEDLAALTLKQASDLVRSKKVSPVELTEACLRSPPEAPPPSATGGAYAIPGTLNDTPAVLPEARRRRWQWISVTALSARTPAVQSARRRLIAVSWD